MEDEARFTNLITRVKARHNEVMPTMAMGIQELKEDLGRKVGLNELPEIHSFLDRFYMSRIGIRMLIGKAFFPLILLNVFPPSLIWWMYMMPAAPACNSFLHVIVVAETYIGSIGSFLSKLMQRNWKPLRLVLVAKCWPWKYNCFLFQRFNFFLFHRFNYFLQGNMWRCITLLPIPATSALSAQGCLL